MISRIRGLCRICITVQGLMSESLVLIVLKISKLFRRGLLLKLLTKNAMHVASMNLRLIFTNLETMKKD